MTIYCFCIFFSDGWKCDSCLYQGLWNVNYFLFKQKIHILIYWLGWFFYKKKLEFFFQFYLDRLWCNMGMPFCALIDCSRRYNFVGFCILFIERKLCGHYILSYKWHWPSKKFGYDVIEYPHFSKLYTGWKTLERDHQPICIFIKVSKASLFLMVCLGIIF